MHQLDGSFVRENIHQRSIFSSVCSLLVRETVWDLILVCHWSEAFSYHHIYDKENQSGIENFQAREESPRCNLELVRSSETKYLDYLLAEGRLFTKRVSIVCEKN